MTKDASFGVIPYYLRDNIPHFLLVHHNVGHWSFPKGHKEKGETSIDAARRELREETGISEVRVDDTKEFYEHYTWDNNGETIDKTVTFYLGEVNRDIISILEKEIQNYAWLTSEEVIKRLTYPATQDVFKSAIQYLEEGVSQ